MVGSYFRPSSFLGGWLERTRLRAGAISSPALVSRSLLAAASTYAAQLVISELLFLFEKSLRIFGIPVSASPRLTLLFFSKTAVSMPWPFLTPSRMTRWRVCGMP